MKDRYEEALERAKEKYFNKEYKPNEAALVKEILTELFPELGESEDERIRRFLHKTFTAQYLAKDKLGRWHNEPVTNILAYLEKLKDFDKRLEQAYKTADEVQYKRGYEDALAFLNKANEEDIREIGEGMELPIIGQRKTDGGIIGVMQRQINELSHSLATRKSEQEWTDEDEIMLNGIIDDFGDGKTSNMLQELWLKSIKPRLS